MSQEPTQLDMFSDIINAIQQPVVEEAIAKFNHNKDISTHDVRARVNSVAYELLGKSSMNTLEFKLLQTLLIHVRM